MCREVMWSGWVAACSTDGLLCSSRLVTGSGLVGSKVGVEGIGGFGGVSAAHGQDRRRHRGVERDRRFDAHSSLAPSASRTVVTK